MRSINISRLILPVVLSLVLSACGGNGEKTQSSTSKSDTEVKAAADTQAPDVKAVMASPTQSPPGGVMSQADLLKRGRIVWFKCRSCHELDVDGPHKVGPNLNGLMGAKAADKDGFVYSASMQKSGITWDEASLDAFIEKPTDYVKGTKMAFVGIRKKSDRDALIAYIKENAKPAE